jgi:hypothetical protein
MQPAGHGACGVKELKVADMIWIWIRIRIHIDQQRWIRIETNVDPQHCLKLSYLLEQDVHEGQAEPDGGDGEVEPGESRLHSALLQAYSGLN